MTDDIRDTLAILHEKLAEDLLRRIQDGSASAADLSAAIKFLKDNGIDVNSRENPTMARLADGVRSFPFESDDEALDEIQRH